MSRLNDLLRRLETTDPALAKDLRQEYDALADRRAFGLNFERHTPEVVQLPGRKVRRGDKVHVLPERGTNPTAENSRLWRVVSIDRARTAPVVSLEALEGDLEEVAEAALEDVVVAAEFRDPIYPGLVSTGRVERGGDRPFHTVINAENYHALQALLFTHRGQVDCIYIDPPYNTGNEGWIYNDKYVAEDDHYRHSKWLAFMERRLLLAKELLKPTGVIIVAIGEEEHHRLRMLMDQVFESQNFLANVVWQGNVKNDAQYTGAGLDYMLIFARDEAVLRQSKRPWREVKPGLDDVLQAAAQAWEGSGHDPVAATAAMKAWWKSLPKDHPALAIKHYNGVDGSGRPGSVYYPGPLMETAGNKVRYVDPIRHPNGRLCPVPKSGWRVSPAVMEGMIREGRIHFGKDENSLPQKKVYLDDVSTSVVSPVFRADRRSAGKRLQHLLGDKRFPFPKDEGVLSRWLGIAAGADSIILDFFGGSGTTAEAVMRLNEADGGRRRCILVTNNEAAAADAKKLRKMGRRPGDPEWGARGVYEYVTKPRVETVVTGTRPDGSTYSDGLKQNVEFFTLTYEAPLAVSSHRQFAKIAPLLWMRTGSTGRRIEDLSTGWDVADTYGVLADLDQTDAFVKAVAAAGDAVTTVFVVTDEDRLFQTVVRALPPHVETIRLYEAYLRNFEIEAGRSAR